MFFDENFEQKLRCQQQRARTQASNEKTRPSSFFQLCIPGRFVLNSRNDSLRSLFTFSQPTELLFHRSSDFLFFLSTDTTSAVCPLSMVCPPRDRICAPDCEVSPVDSRWGILGARSPGITVRFDIALWYPLFAHYGASICSKCPRVPRQALSPAWMR